MIAFEKYGYKFKVFRIQDENKKVYIVIYRDGKEYDSGYAYIKGLKEAIGYDHEENEVDFMKFPEYGKVNRIIIE